MSLQETIVEGMLRSELCPWGVKQSLSYLKNTGNFHPVLWLENYFRRDYNHQLANLPMISFDFGICSAWYQYHQSLHPCHFRLQNSSSPSDLAFKWMKYPSDLKIITVNGKSRIICSLSQKNPYHQNVKWCWFIKGGSFCQILKTLLSLMSHKLWLSKFLQKSYSKHREWKWPG